MNQHLLDTSMLNPCSIDFGMTHVVGVQEASQRLEELIDLAIAGEPVFLAVDEEHYLQLVPLHR